MKPKVVCLFAACAAVLLAQTQLPPVVLEIQTDNWREYVFDTPDVTQRATLPLATSVRPQFTFIDGTGVADIVAVNGKPAYGLWTNRWQYMRGTLRTPHPARPSPA